MEIRRIFDLLDRYEQYDKPVLFGGKTDGVMQTYSKQQYLEHAKSVSYGLMHNGIGIGDKIITITTNRPEWNFLDMGIMMCGAIHVPVYPNLSDDDYNYIIDHSDAKLIFVTGEELFQRISKISSGSEKIKSIFTFRNLHGYNHLWELIETGSQNPKEEVLNSIKMSIKSDDVATIIYTSGTTGLPKGVMLTHENFISNFIDVHTIPPTDPKLTALSFLPLCHVYERMLNYCWQYNGYTIYYLDNIGYLSDYIKEVRPHIVTSVPRVLENIFDKIMAKGRKLTGIPRLLFFQAVRLGLKYDKLKNNPWYRFRLFFARKLVFRKWLDALGGQVDIIVSGGAAIQERLENIFWAAGIRVIEGYGLTETSPVIAVSNFEKGGIKFGTVGPVLPSVKVSIAEDGEILVKGPNVMKGYFKEPELTLATFTDDGWFKTGDIGLIMPEGQLKITDRKKEIFKTSAGKYIAPQRIENKLKESSFIENAMVVGDNQKFAAAIISPNFSHIQSYCIKKKIPFTSNSEIIRNEFLRKKIQKEVEKVNQTLGDHERIIKFELCAQAWTPESGELTPTLKLKRNLILNKYQALMGKLFNN